MKYDSKYCLVDEVINTFEPSELANYMFINNEDFSLQLSEFIEQEKKNYDYNNEKYSNEIFNFENEE